jgi:hypothetical protein
MNRLKHLIQLVEAEQKVVRNGGTAADVEALCRHQDRLLQHIVRTGKTAPFELFEIPLPEVKQ